MFSSVLLLYNLQYLGNLNLKNLLFISPKTYRNLSYTTYNNFSHHNCTSNHKMLTTSSKIDLEPFCFKQFDSRTAENHIPIDKSAFLQKVQELLKTGDCKITDGYAEFCKHIFFKNFTEAKYQVLEITPENQHLLRSAYLRRTEKELPVLTRWFPLSKVNDLLKPAEYLDVIFYSRKQIELEREAMREEDHDDDRSVDYYVVAVKPTNQMAETPMNPITIMRNALIDQGGSGVPIDNDKYMESVKYWSKHALVADR